MAISKRQEKRLTNLANMISKARIVADEFQERNSEYEEELSYLIEQIKSLSIKKDLKIRRKLRPKRQPFRSGNKSRIVFPL